MMNILLASMTAYSSVNVTMMTSKFKLNDNSSFELRHVYRRMVAVSALMMTYVVLLENLSDCSFHNLL